MFHGLDNVLCVYIVDVLCADLLCVMRALESVLCVAFRAACLAAEAARCFAQGAGKDSLQFSNEDRLVPLVAM